jgi:hypothetical protein
MRPVSFAARVSVGSLGHSLQLESSRPATESNETLSWLSHDSIAPSARLINLDAQARWQNWLAASGIGLGIGGSLLAALLFELVTRQPERRAVSATDSAVELTDLGRTTPDEDSTLLGEQSSRRRGHTKIYLSAAAAAAAAGVGMRLLARRGRNRIS